MTLLVVFVALLAAAAALGLAGTAHRRCTHIEQLAASGRAGSAGVERTLAEATRRLYGELDRLRLELRDPAAAGKTPEDVHTRLLQAVAAAHTGQADAEPRA